MGGRGDWYGLLCIAFGVARGHSWSLFFQVEKQSQETIWDFIKSPVIVARSLVIFLMWIVHIYHTYSQTGLKLPPEAKYFLIWLVITSNAVVISACLPSGRTCATGPLQTGLDPLRDQLVYFKKWLLIKGLTVTGCQACLLWVYLMGDPRIINTGLPSNQIWLGREAAYSC